MSAMKAIYEQAQHELELEMRESGEISKESIVERGQKLLEMYAQWCRDQDEFDFEAWLMVEEENVFRCLL